MEVEVFLNEVYIVFYLINETFVLFNFINEPYIPFFFTNEPFFILFLLCFDRLNYYKFLLLNFNFLAEAAYYLIFY